MQSIRTQYLHLAAIAFLGLSPGCASTPKFRPVQTLPQDKSVVYVYRPSRMLGGLVPITLSLDGQKVVNIWSGDYQTLVVNPGEHFLVPYGDHEAKQRTAFVGISGQESYVKVEPAFGGPKITAVTSDVGKREIADCNVPDGADK